MPDNHLSSSIEQQSAEAVVLRLLSARLGCGLIGETIPLVGDGKAKVDGINRDERIVCEVYCRIGSLRGSQSDKVASDMLKLLLVEKTLGGAWRKILCFVDASAAQCVKGQSWLSVASKQFSCEIEVVP